MARQTRKKKIAKRVTKKKAVRRVAKKKTTVKRNTIKVQYCVIVQYPNNTKRYYDGIKLTPNKSQAAYFDNLKQAAKVARALAEKVRYPVTVHDNKAEKKK